MSNNPSMPDEIRLDFKDGLYMDVNTTLCKGLTITSRQPVYKKGWRYLRYRYKCYEYGGGSGVLHKDGILIRAVNSVNGMFAGIAVPPEELGSLIQILQQIQATIGHEETPGSGVGENQDEIPY